jgi:hypothetical protein
MPTFTQLQLKLNGEASCLRLYRTDLGKDRDIICAQLTNLSIKDGTRANIQLKKNREKRILWELKTRINLFLESEE